MIKHRQIPIRNELVDFLRGGAMIFVLLHHSGFPLGKYILAFHMPLFFIISGYIYQNNKPKESFFMYVKRRFVRLMIPYFCFEIINLVIWIILCYIRHESVNIIDAFISIITCINTSEYSGLYGRLWFLPCMFMSSIMFKTIIDLHKSKFSLIASLLLTLLLSWISTHILKFRLPFTIDTAFMALFFMLSGFVLGKFIEYCLQTGHLIIDIILSFCCLVFLYIAVVNNGQMLMYINAYGDYANSIVAAFSGSFAFIIIGKYIYRLFLRFRLCKSFILWYGTNSLAVFPVHLQIKCIGLLLGIPFFNMNYWYVIFLVMLFLSVPIVYVLRKFFPFLTGNKR